MVPARYDTCFLRFALVAACSSDSFGNGPGCDLPGIAVIKAMAKVAIRTSTIETIQNTNLPLRFCVSTIPTLPAQITHGEHCNQFYFCFHRAGLFQFWGRRRARGTPLERAGSSQIRFAERGWLCWLICHHPHHHWFHAIESFLQDAARGREAKADVSAGAFAEPAWHSGDQRHTSLIEQAPAKAFRVFVQTPDAGEYDVSSLRCSYSHARPAGEAFRGVVALPGQMSDKVSEPRRAIAERGNHGDLGQNRGAEDSALGVGGGYDCLAPLGIAADDAANPQSSERKVLGESVDGHGALRDFAGKRGHRRVVMRSIHDVRPDLVGENPQVLPHCPRGHGLQPLARIDRS